MTTNLDLLKTIYNATISLPIKQRINPDKKGSVTIDTYYSNKEPFIAIKEKVTLFDYRLNPINDMKYRYSVEVYKTEPTKFLGLVTKEERYFLRVQIYEVSRYSSGNFSSGNFSNEYFFDSYKDKTPLLKDLFTFLMKRNSELNEIEQSDQFEKYVNDLSKLVDKSVTREETLNKILENE